jgi:hypothetical protein
MTTPPPGSRNQAGLRTTFRVLGVAVLVVGLLLTVLGVTSLFAAAGSFESPDRFWMAFVGLPLVAVGGWLLQAGFGGAAARYAAGELAPTARDTMDYLGVGEGAVRCAGCGSRNDARARFCDDCGQSLARSCAHCQTANAADDRFCAGCGTALG